MNHCMLMAEILSAPQLRYTQETQTPIAEMAIAFPGLRADDPPQQMKAIGWGNVAQEIQSQVQVGDRVLIEGRLTMNTVDRPEGFKEKHAELTIRRIYRLSDLNALEIPKSATPETATVGAAATPQAAYSAVGQPTATPSTPDPEVDYDDIPF